MATLSRRITLEKMGRLRRIKRVRNWATLGLVLGPALAFATYLVLGPLGQGADTFSLRLILLTDLIYVLLVAALVLSEVARLIAARRAKSAGSRLHLRLTGVFALMALIPTVSVAVFAMLTVNVGLEGWFSDRVRGVVGSSLAAAQAYEAGQRSDLIEDAQTLARSIDNARIGRINLSDQALLGEGQRQIQRGLKEAYLIDGTSQIRSRGDRSYLFDFEAPSETDIRASREDGITLIEDWPNSELRAIVPMHSFSDRFLYVSRTVDGRILSLLDETAETARLYQQLESDRGRLLFDFGLLYLGFAVILILAAVWLGLWFAERLSGPLGRLTGAAQRVGAGDLSVRVREEDGDDEIAMLGRYFNQMTKQLRGQRETLLDNTRQIERRRRLFDSVLSSVTSGVVGLDPEGRVTFVNRSAMRLLDWTEDQQSVALSVAIPEFGPLFDTVLNGPGEIAQGEVKVSRQGALENLLVRMATRRSEDGSLEGYVVAFDDVTDLVSAQRMAAWGDVARRIAHEIKNPLTPIQLSAERIRRKFAPKLGDDSDALEQMTGVIIRQTGDLRRIVDEFSKFARMPEPETSKQDLTQLVRDAVFLQQSGQPDVEINADLPNGPVMAEIDGTMISQALTNLIKNAGEAIESLQKKTPPDNLKPQVAVAMKATDTNITLTIADNGIGLPEDRAALFEPYVTTRSEGTGLGLPIVKKIIEEHGGTLVLENAPVFAGQDHFGAMAVITLPHRAGSKTIEWRTIMSDILIVDDERDIRELISDILEDEGFATRLAGNSDDAMAAINAEPPALMILDIWLKDSDMDGIDILKATKRDNPDVPVVIISGHGNVEIAVAAIRQGAYDFIEKPFNIDQLMVVIRRAMETSRLRRENLSLKRRDSNASDMLGSSAAYRALVSQLDKVTKSNGRVMLSGPAGSGKEVAARYIHANSNRASAPFVTVNCAGVEPDRMEEMLFGREGTERGLEPGLLEQAHGGVIYFDEVADMPLGTQSKILRVLVDQQFTRVGGSDKVRVDLRVISSTNKDLEAAIEAETFRQELFHRLNVVPIAVPSLEERREDIPELAEYFIAECHDSQGLPKRELSSDVVALMQTMIWPGNVRQLKNLVERVLILGDGTGPIEARELPGEEDRGEEDGRVILSSALATLPLREAREAFEREYLLTQINRFGGNISRTANFVGMERSALHRKLKSLGVVTSAKSGVRVAHVDEEEPVGG